MNNKKIALYVTGSIAAYKSLTLARLLIKNGNEVRVVMSGGAQQFVTPLAFQTLTKNFVFTDTFDEKDANEITHIDIATWADISIVAPATANTIAKLVNGIGDNAVTTTLLATPSKKVLVPAMNNNMWDNPATQRNIKQIESDGYKIMYPTSGFLAEGYEAKGRMIEPEEIIERLELIDHQSNKLSGKKMIVTAGGTREAIDPVRYISNNSSGKMGYAIAKAAMNAGAEVTLISSSETQHINGNVSVINVSSSSEMKNAIEDQFNDADVLVMAAAVSDYTPAEYSEQKIKKNDDELDIHLVKTPDILKELSKIKNHQFVVGFAAETQNLLDNAKQKLAKKKLNLLLANDVSNKAIGFNSDNNQVSFIDETGVFKKSDVESKDKIASELIDIISERID
ncbi:bifunctional phosphopantothenoylcysteine decarboxylase/phosphopantothenate--cysteine ligase CoaBC [Apilactobacillus zhangqiuensis]|uniref:bifunctional phosphopantothenoylcysteine decarboxylase/phosphopantothenate--cysteine ligase CoaBC n=1 Tax=Apilactobacillus zhangqiuensis TaxID=2841031 RepID=UPI001C7CEC13|nr:bifunctional phosphopantothenoylcysteine decarboxylase/phosphopantothenate--cysteine ligase CoaBC [Apilactobacillus zhangqiuensis]